MNTEIPRRMLGSIGGVGALVTGSLVTVMIAPEVVGS
jgi:hypothetical protein